MDEGDGEVLVGGVANAGLVRRVGDEVRRPANAHSADVHEALRRLRVAGCTAAPEPLGVADGEERLVFVPGDVPVEPFPAWAATGRALASIARLLRQLHDVSASLDLDDLSFSDELVDPGPFDGHEIVLCHDDVCPENVVFRDGEAIALLDWDFAALGRREHDLALMAVMCLPVDVDDHARGRGFSVERRPDRLREIADAYGLDEVGRGALLVAVDDVIARGGEFVLRHVEAGEPGFVAMWDQIGGMARFDRRRAWWAAHRDEYAAALA